jgi:hypothetical protein
MKLCTSNRHLLSVSSKILVFFSLIVFIGFTSCKKEQKNSLRTIDLVHAGEMQKVNLSQFASDISYIPLSTSEEDLVSFIVKVVRTDSSYFVSDGRDLYRFSSEGDYICKIGHRGKGGEEFLTVADFGVDQSKGMVYVLGFTKIQVYNEEGNYVKTIKLDKDLYGLIMRLELWNGNFLCSLGNPSGKSSDMLLWLNDGGKLIKAFKNTYRFNRRDSAIMFNRNEFLFYSFDGTLQSKNIHSDTVRTFSDGQFLPKFVFEQGQERFTPEVQGSGKEYISHMDDYINFTGLFETPHYLWAEYRLHKKLYGIIAAKATDKQYVYDAKTGLTDDLGGGPGFKPIKELTIDGQEYLLGWITPLELKTYVSSDDFSQAKALLPEKKKQMETLAGQLNENDNPVLVLAKLKN